MWAYQPHFRGAVEIRTSQVLTELGIPEPGVECLLVGALRPGRQNPNPVCLEPEDGKWPIGPLDGLPDAIEQEIASHPMQDVVFSDEPSMRDKPENIRRDAVRISVEKALLAFDEEHDVCSFAGPPAPVGDYHVVPVLQLSRELFRRFRQLQEAPSFSRYIGHRSLIHSAVASTLSEAHDELLRPDPGRYFGLRFRSSAEVARHAASRFMWTPGIAMQDRHFGDDLFDHLNSISSLMYEGSKGTGRLVLARPGDPRLDMWLTFETPVPFREERWARKMLQLASSDAALVADCENIFGLGRLAKEVEPGTSHDVFEVEFLDRNVWRLICGDEVMLLSRNGSPSLPREQYPSHRVFNTYRRLFSEVTEHDVTRFRALIEAAVGQQHGSLLIVAEDAESEANRLRVQGMRVEPTQLTACLYRQVSRIDGAILMDPHGTLHAIGVILDGPARPEGTPSRGARYNSGMRYVHAAATHRLAVVVSDDQTVDVSPVLRPRIDPATITAALSDLESEREDDYQSAIRWLDRHRFYLNQEQCDRINAVLEQKATNPLEVGEIRLSWTKFSPDPELDNSYFQSEEEETPEAVAEVEQMVVTHAIHARRHRPCIPLDVSWAMYWQALQECDAWWKREADFSIFPPGDSWVGVIRKLRPSMSQDWSRFDVRHQKRLLGCAAQDEDDWALLGNMLGFAIKPVFGDSATRRRIETIVKEVISAEDSSFLAVANTAYARLTALDGISTARATRLLTLARPDRCVSLNSASEQVLATYAASALTRRSDMNSYGKLLQRIHQQPWFARPESGFGSPMEEEARSMRVALLDAFIYSPNRP